MREMLVETRQLDAESGPYSFDYYILVDQMEVADGLSCESYGVKIARSGGGEAASIPNLTASVSRIDALMELLTRNSVTPTTLRDVVDDWL